MRISLQLFLLFTFILLLNQQNSFGQIKTDQSKIWSLARVLPEPKKEVLPEVNWIPPNQIPKYYDMGIEITVYPNFRPHPNSSSTQSETSVDVHPSNNNIVFASANASDWPVTTIYGTGVYWTLNGGTTWSGNDNPSTLTGFGSNSGDPCSIIGGDGRLYENYISNSGGQGVSVSTNNGANWSTYAIAPNPGSLADKNHYMVDKKSSSPYYNRSYCTWTDFGGTNNYDIVFKYSTNFGQTWSSAINLSNSLSAFNHGVNVQTGPNGEVYVTWAVYLGSSNTIEDGIGFAKSTNGGVSWTTPIYAYQHTDFGIRGYLSSKGGMRINSFPTMAVDRSNGNIYICWTQRGVTPAGSDPDIVMVKSTDGGGTWSTPFRVNDDALNNGKDQVFPWCTVDQATGQVIVEFYDSRNVVNSQAEVYLACSLNGGSTFNNFAVSDQSFVLGPITGFNDSYGGDYTGVAAYNNVAYPYWRDSRTGNAQGWMAKVTFGPPCPVAAPINPSPSNGATSISINLTQLNWTNGAGSSKCEVWYGTSGNMSKVYDGNLVSTWNIPSTLSFNTTYNWQIIDKNDTCSTSGSVWTFTTELSPGIVFTENFNSLNCWSAIGPLGTTNWSTQNTTNAGGTAPELQLNWTPQFNGLSKLVSCPISVMNNRHYSISLKHMIDWYATIAPTLGIGVSYDNGATYTSIWSVTPTGDVGPETVNATFVTPVSDSPDAINLYLVLYCNGNSYNIDYWYVDDINLNDDDYFSVADPTSILATAVSSSQIDVAFTPNVINNNVVVIWNSTGTFTTPTGTPPSIGQSFAGGTLLYNGTISPVHHNGLNPFMTYYYKLFSYNGTTYSPGVNANATTLNIADPTNVTATAINNSQINVAFNPNSINNNVVVVWNLTGLFTIPSGIPPAIGQSFAGGTLLYNGTNSPIQHTGLTSLTTYYYKLFSYTGSYFSQGISTNATTLSILDFGVSLAVSDNCGNNTHTLIFGTGSGATDCYDIGFDLSAPPPPPVGAIDGRFLSCNDAFFTDIRGSNPSGETIWDVRFQPNQGCSPMSLSWNPVLLPATGYFHLVDPYLGTLVNVNMRTRSNFIDVMGLGELLITYNYQICSNFNISNGWNMISLPTGVVNNNYLTLFPNAVPGTLYGYNGSYVTTTNVQNGVGYWLKFPATETVEICGTDITQSVLNLAAGWNMIGGANCNAPVSSVIDPSGIIIPGTLYGYNGSYTLSNSIDATKGYWIKTNAVGTITITCSTPVSNNLENENVIAHATDEFSKIKIIDAAEFNQTLYYNGELGEELNIESFSMPPLPPQGNFDARLVGDYRLTESDEATIKIQSSEYPVRVTISNLKSNESYFLLEIANGTEVSSHRLTEGLEIVISDEKVNLLKITKEQAIPTAYNLEQNYPNPFNPSTTIKFSLPEAAKVRLTIYNTLGERVAEVVNTNLEAGWYSYQWDATNIATGIYIYELRTDKFISIKKMVFMK